MYDSSLVYEQLVQISEALVRIERRFSRIDSPDSFLGTEQGMDMLDAIGMMLIAIGENLKKIDQTTKGELLKRYPGVNWKGAKGTRDIISHHYFDLDAAEVFDICEQDLPAMRNVIKQMIEELSNSAAP
ncbi:MAG: DUF86 domain-containing protein [Gammaproteobacteria bacterium]|nr:DUF86 domain-containing protein [Gammaproteobacteria bacterium]